MFAYLRWSMVRFQRILCVILWSSARDSNVQSDSLCLWRWWRPQSDRSFGQHFITIYMHILIFTFEYAWAISHWNSRCFSLSVLYDIFRFMHKCDVWHVWHAWHASKNPTTIHSNETKKREWNIRFQNCVSKIENQKSDKRKTFIFNELKCLHIKIMWLNLNCFVSPTGCHSHFSSFYCCDLWFAMFLIWKICQNK